MNRIILVHNKLTGVITSYTSLKCFTEHNTKYKLNTLNNYISRKRISYEDQELVICRVELIGRK